MQNPVLMTAADTDKKEGAIYKFANAATGIDVYIRVDKMVNAYIAAIDRTDLGYGYAWQPHIPSTSADGGYVDWFVYFKVGGTNKDTTACPTFTAIDIDGAGASSGVHEYVEADGYDTYNTMTPTALTLSPSTSGYTLKALGPETAYDGISTTEKSVMIQFNYNNVTGFKYRTGVQGLAPENIGRYFSLHFNNYLTCDNLTNAGQIGSDETHCSAFDPQLIANISTPTGGNGDIEYQWLKNTVSSNPTDVNWQVIPNTNNMGYDPPSVSATIYYMRQARRINCSEWVSSNVVAKRISPTLSVNISSDVSTICPYGSVNLSATVSPSNLYSYQWQKSTDNSTWVDIGGATKVNRKEINIAGEVYFRVKVTINSCPTFSTSLKISTYDTTPPVLSGVPADKTVQCNAVPAAATPTATDNCQLLDIVLHEIYSSCTNPVLNANSGIENVSNVAMDTTFQGYPAKKLPNYSNAITGWEMGFPAGATNAALMVKDNNNSINNPNGDYFLWVPSNSYCVINNPIALQAGQCVDISLWAAAFSNVNPQYSTRILVEIVRVSDNTVFEPYSQVLPASTSFQNMNWQNVVTKFVTPTTGSYKFVVTQQVDAIFGPSPKGFAIDGLQIKNCCDVAPTSGCKNYTITRTWTARDQTGNATTQTQVITVEDTQAPVFTNAPTNATVCNTVPAAPSITATDNCDATPSVVLTSEVSTKTSNNTCSDKFYTVTRTWTASDACGNKNTATQIITVVTTPTVTITTTPLCVGGTAILTANMDACVPAVTYQWQQWNSTIWVNIGTNSAIHTTPALTTNQDYRVIATVTGSNCICTSPTVTVTPTAGLSVSITTPNATVCKNNSAILMAAVTGGAGIKTYQWQSSADGSNWTNIGGETTTTYSAPTNLTGVVYYQVLVSANGSGCGNVSSAPTTVEVVESLLLTAQLTGFIECIGGTKTLTATITGGKDITYQWLSSADNVNWLPLAGEINGTYTPPSVSAGKMYYKVTFTSAGSDCGTITSNAALIEIVDKPSAGVAVEVTTVCVGGSVVLTATITDLTNSCSIQWQSKTGTGNWTAIAGATQNTYTAEALSSTTRYRAALNCAASGCCN